MPTFRAIDLHTSDGKAKQLLERLRAELGMIPNILCTLANSPAALEAYLGFSDALSRGALSAKLREQIALAVAEANDCEYCLAAHTATGRAAGLSEEQLLDSRRGTSPDSRGEAALRFAREIVEKRGRISAAGISRLRSVGYGDGEIAEIVAQVAIYIFMNYFDHVAQPDVDFPRVARLAP